MIVFVHFMVNRKFPKDWEKKNSSPVSGNEKQKEKKEFKQMSSKGGDQWHKILSWRSVTSGVSQWSIGPLGSIWFYLFTVTRMPGWNTADDIKQGGGADWLAGWAAFQGDMDRLEKWVNRNFLKLIFLEMPNSAPGKE